MQITYIIIIMIIIFIFIIIMYKNKPTHNATLIETYLKNEMSDNRAMRSAMMTGKFNKKTKEDIVYAPAIYADISDNIAQPQQKVALYLDTVDNYLEHVDVAPVLDIYHIIDKAEELDDGDIQSALFNSYRDMVSHKRKSEKQNEHTDREVAVTQYLDVEYVNNPQNVHDTNLNNELSQRYKDIQKINDVQHITIDDVQVDAYGLDDSIVISKYNATEAGILREVLRRIHSHDNAENKADLLSNLERGLDDAKELCTMGRVDRMLDIFTLLDKDTSISQPVKTNNILRKEILEYSSDTFKSELSKKDAEFMKKYNSEEQHPDVDKFNDDVFNSIHKYVMDEYAPRHDDDILLNILSEVKYAF